MKLKTLYLTENACYKSGKRMTPKGVMVHSTGANNPNLKRYVGPDDGLLGVNQYGNHWNTDKPGGRSVCVHAFVGKLKDGSIATYQTLPWDMVGWHSGSGSKGSAKNANNNGYIGFEICEDSTNDAAYLKKVYTEAVELVAYLCKKYNLDPLKDGVVICHSEGHARGIASNHGDVMHWWPKHGLSMDTFRKAVAAEMGAAAPAAKPTVPTASAGNAEDNAAKIWKYLIGKGLSECGVAGLMGNLHAESALAPNNLQNTYSKKLGMTDAEYTAAVDSGAYTNFVRDSAGYGLAQWTYWSRKEGLLTFAKAAGKSIGDLGMQLDFLWKELSEGYTSVLRALRNAKTVREASDVVLTKYERPADQSESVKKKRAQYGETFLKKYGGKASGGEAVAATPYLVKVTTDVLNIRKGPGTNYGTAGQIRDRGVYTIVAESTGTGASKWGKLKSGAGWISLDYAKKA